MKRNKKLVSKKKISLLLPSRGRISLVKQLFKSIIKNTINLERLEIIMCLDDDDKISQEIEESRLNIIKLVGTKSSMGEYNTRCLNHSSGDIVMLVNDDLTVETRGWDEIISDFAETISDEIFMAYPNDAESRGRLCTFPIMSRKTCEILSNPYPKEYAALEIDKHILDIFIRLKYIGENRIFYFDHILFKHNHFRRGKARSDASYSHKKRLADAMVFISLRHLRQVSARRLFLAIKGVSLTELPNQVVFEKIPLNLFEATLKYFNVFLKDYGLPFDRRLLLFFENLKYYAAMEGGFHFLKNKMYELYGVR